MGDMLTLIEQAEKTFDQDQAAKAAEKLSGQGGEFTLDDFLEQMQQVRKLGSMSKIMGMLPGMGQFRDQLENFDEREIDRIQAIIQSMTPAERANPKMIDGSRRARIAKGSGRTVSDVNQLVDRFFEARKMMMSMASGGGMPGMPGMPGMAGGGKRAKAKQPKKGKGKRVSGNPAKAAAAGEGRAGEGRRAGPPPTRSATRTARRSTTRRPPPRSTCPRTSPSSSSDRPGSAGRRRRQRRRRPARRLVEGPRRCGPAAARGAAGRGHCRTTRSCWCSRAGPRAGCGRDGTGTCAPCTPRATATTRSSPQVAGRRRGRATGSRS